jgi:hypothetical protein
MKKFFVITPIVVLTAVGILMVRGSADSPLQLGVVGFTNRNGGSQSVRILLTNDSAGHFIFGARVQSFSDPELRHLVSDTHYRSSGQVLSPRSITPHIIDTFQNGGVIRLRIPYRRVPGNFQNFLNRCLARLRIEPWFKPSEPSELVSGPIPLP